MNKTLKFYPELVPLILSGQKTSTWRLWDDKDLSEGDIVDFLNKVSAEKFYTGRLTTVIKKPFVELTAEDHEGHEEYETDEAMYEHFSKIYGKPVDGNTAVTIIRFEAYGK